MPLSARGSKTANNGTIINTRADTTDTTIVKDGGEGRRTGRRVAGLKELKDFSKDYLLRRTTVCEGRQRGADVLVWDLGFSAL